MAIRANRWWGAACVWFFAVPAAMAEEAMPQVIAQENSLYNTVYVTQEGGQRCMRFSLVLPGRQSCVDPAAPSKLVFVYTQAMMTALYLQPKTQKILMIGLGGGSLPMALRSLYPEAEIDSVEIDPVVAKLAEQYFFFKPDAKQHVTINDGRYFVRRALADQRRYDLILLDAYGKNYIPEHMLTLNFMMELKGILAPGGVLAANTASSGALYAYESATYVAAFGEIYNLKPQGRVVIAARDGLPPLATVEANAKKLDPVLQPLGVDSTKLLPLFAAPQDWPKDAPVLTDKYAPADLLNRMPALPPDPVPEKKP